MKCLSFFVGTRLSESSTNRLESLDRAAAALQRQAVDVRPRGIQSREKGWLRKRFPPIFFERLKGILFWRFYQDVFAIPEASEKRLRRF